MKKLNVCMISGSFEYDSRKSLKIFQKYLAENYPLIETELIIYQDEDDNPSLRILESTDVIIIFTRRIRISGENLERLQEYCQTGKPIIGIRTASHAYENWLDFDTHVLGGSYQGHFGHGPISHVEILESQIEHSILEGISNFDAFGSLYKNPSNAADTTTLMTAKTNQGHCQPVTWIRERQVGESISRVFYTSLGHQDDFHISSFLQMLANAIFWTTRQ